MAGGPRKLPKWQASANGMPNDATANTVPNNIFFRQIFFICFSSFGW